MLPDFEPFDARGRRRRVPRLRRAAAAVRARHDHLAARGARPGQAAPVRGAQGSLLDVDHGSYPYVTSSNSSAAGIAAGSGVPTRHIDRWIGVVKAYTTRVGGGPFPTEQDNAIGERIRRVGKEYGTVTGRPRRCGWFDAVAVRYSARVSGVDRDRPHAPGRPQRASTRSGSPSPTRTRPAGRDHDLPGHSPTWSGAGPSTRRCPAGRGPDRGPVLGRPARQRRETTSASCPSRSASPSRSSRSAPSGGRRIRVE